MKRTLYQIGMLAIAALAFASCAKEVEGNKPEKAYTHYATVTLGKAGDTRTAVTEGQNSASYTWTTGDEQYLHVFENDTEGEITNIAYSQDMKTATLTVAFTGTPTAPYVYTARYFTEESNAHNPLIQEEQHPTESSFDPAADIMVSKEISSANERLSELAFTMGRVVTVNKMTLTGLGVGEKVSKVEITFDKSVVAYYVPGTGAYSAHRSKITLEYDDPVTVPANAEVPVYFISAPVEDAAFKSVVVTTDVNVYTKSDSLDPNPFEGKTITFAIGTMKRFKMAMAGYDAPIGDEVKYYKVTDSDQIADGAEYLIVSTKNSDGDLVAMGAYSGTYYSAVDVAETVADCIGIISEAVITVTFEDAGSSSYYLRDSENNYLYYDSGNSVSRGPKVESSAYKWTVTWTTTASGTTMGLTNVGASSRKLQYNSSNPRFACYTTAQKAISLYYKEGSIVELEDPSLVFTLNGMPVVDLIEVSWDERENFVSPTVNAPDGLSVTYSSDNEDVATVDPETGEVTFVGNGEAVIFANTPKTDVFKAGEANYSLVVTGKPVAAGYQLVTSTDEVTDGLYVIAAKVEDKYYAMSNTIASKIDGTEVTVTANVISTGDGEDYSFTITNTGNDVFEIGGANGSLGWNSSTNFAIDGDNTAWTIGAGVNGTFRAVNVASSRVLAFNGSKFGPYAASNVTAGSNSYFDIELFKFNGTAPVIKPTPETTVTPASITLEIGQTQELTVTTNSDGAITYESSDDAIATVDADGVVEAIAAGNATITVKTAETDNFKAGSTQIPVAVSAGASTIADVLAGGAGTYEVPNVTVYAVKGAAMIIGDETAKMYAYKSNHGLSVGDVRTVNGTTKVYNEVYEFDAPTFTGTGTTTVNHGTAVEIDVVASTLQSSFTTAGNKYTAVYAHVIGTQSGRNITTDGGTVLYLSAKEDATDGGTVEAYGYVYAYSTSHSNFDFIVTSIAAYVDPNAPALNVDPTFANWGSGENDTKTFTVSATNGTWGIAFSDGLADWATVSTTANTITVTPKVAQAAADNTGSITVTLTPTGTGYSTKTATIDLYQAKYSAGGNTPDPETITFASLGLENGVQYLDPFNGGHFTITFAGGDNDGKYYTTGSGMRTYGGGTITIASTSNKIAEIEFTWSGSYAPDSDVASPSGYSTSTKKWIGSANSVVMTRPSGSGHWRLQAVKVTYE